MPFSGPRWIAARSPGIVCLAAGVLALAAASATAQEPPAPDATGSAEAPATAWTVAVDAQSRYMFGGVRFSEDPVLHPSLAVSRSGFTLTGYGTYYTERDHLAELDVFLEYARDAGPLTLGAGVSAYHFDLEDGWNQTIEAYLAATWNVPSYPTLYVSRDFEIGDGWLIDASLNHEIAAGATPLQFALSLVYNGHYYREGSGYYAQLRVDAPIAIGSSVTLKPWLAYLESFDAPELLSTFFGGVVLSVDF